GFVGTMEGTAIAISAHMPADVELDEAGARDVAREVIKGCIAEGVAVPGLGHPVHKHGDPRTTKLFQLAEELGFAGNFVKVAAALPAAFELEKGRLIPLNATGALGALVCEL